MKATDGCASLSHEIQVCHLGMVSYRDALALQHDIRARRLAGELPDVLLLLEHPPVYTHGRRSAPGELTLGEDFYRARGIEVVQTDRGGRVTYHGPGQLVGYPIMHVTDIGAHLRTMESAIVAALRDCGVKAHSRCAEGPDYTGVWVADGAGQGGGRNRARPARKIASIGVHVSRGISTHGFAVNVDNDLTPFTWIVACGLPDVTMTSLAQELPRGQGVAAEDFSARLTLQFCEAHRRRLRPVTPRELMRGRTPRAHALRTRATCADAAPPDPTPDTASLLSRHGAPV